MKKEIYFYINASSCWNVANNILTYQETDIAIQNERPCIHTTSIAHLSFDLINLGYDIYLCYNDKKVKIEPHMDLSGKGEHCKDLRFGHNIFKLFRAGVFNDLLGIERQ